MKKVVIKLIGGLGNQFFQYAAARALAKKIDAELKFDVSDFDDYKVRNYELNNFCVEQVFATVDEVLELKKKSIFNKTYFKEKNGRFIKLHPKGSAYLEGYFQSEKYFKGAEFEIRSAFEFRNFDFIKNHGILDEIRRNNAVSINIRGGEYINNPKIEKIYNVCGREYYKNAIKYARAKLGDVKFYVFSDDLDYAKTILEEGEFVETANWAEDLYFMQNCKHNIIANSSFSWAAAWLNKNPKKTVIAPKKWYRDGSGINYKNVVPADWVKI